MRIAALYDIHGNLPALEAVLADVRRRSVDLVVVGGDVVPGPMPAETLACLQALDVATAFIRGNGDRIVAAQYGNPALAEIPEAYRAAISWNAQRLGEDGCRVIGGWPETFTAACDLGDVFFCHATAHNDVEIVTRLTDDDRFAAAFADAAPPIVVCGHTHMQFDRTAGRHRVVNAGSVGMPFGEPGAYWLLLDDDARLQHTAYDLEDAARRIRATEYPGAAQLAEQNVLRPPTEAAMLAAFSR